MDAAPSLRDVTVAISTLADGCDGVVLPPPAAGLRYLVLVQQPPAPLPVWAERPDTQITPLDTLGLSHSRNAALALCQTPFLAFADDDMTLDTDGLRALADALEGAPALGFAAGWRAGRRPVSGARAGIHPLRKHTAGRICAPELMVRIAAVHAAGVTFDPRFGVGAPHPIGEDYVFVCDMLGAGLRGQGFPIVTGTHHGPSTGDDWHSPQVQYARRAVIARSFGRSAPMVRALYALRHKSSLGGWRAAWRFWAGQPNSTEHEK